MDIQQILKTSFNSVIDEFRGVSPSGPTHRKMSSAWVESLSDSFRAYYQDDQSIRVFSKGNDENIRDFGVNELLYDILVCRVASVTSAKHGKVLYYVSEAIWQIESELAKDSRQALLDFNKLVLGSAINKLFIGPLVQDPYSFIEVLLPAARFCNGDVYLSLIPHPESWYDDYDEKSSIRVWKLGEDWLEVDTLISA